MPFKHRGVPFLITDQSLFWTEGEHLPESGTVPESDDETEDMGRNEEGGDRRSCIWYHGLVAGIVMVSCFASLSFYQKSE